ncbi:extracellular solute-binding protein [Bacillus horti]|uniref:Cellobiose transport system substrate-binding protein n=1 Tax=Caldalkalibacillus horti TaxID=77523 RepID=A0ABT9VVH6_9BACI|nr:extracellular solute-binding protein [Bacillus horti]MDQ0164994.1 cellobiose transport system substrate-binding protein [Bacillus horti]
MKRKYFFTIGLSILLLFALAACSSSGTSSEEGDGDKISMNFWIFGATGYEELVKEYEELNENITINVRHAETADHHDALFNSLSAGSGAPDIAMLEVDQVDRYRTAQDRFVNLYDLGARDIEGNYLDWKWQFAESTDGEFLFGLPTDIGPKALYYRTEIFEEAGLPTDPDELSAYMSSPEKFREAAIQIKDATGKPMVANIEMMYRSILDTLEESYFDPESNLIIEEPGNRVREAYDYAIEMNELGVVGNFTMWSAEWGNAVNNGGVAVELGAAWFKGWMEGNAPDAEGEFQVATLPTEFTGNWGGSYITIPNQTDHAEEAYAFLEWLLSAETQLKSFKSNGLFPSATAVYEMDDFVNATDDYFSGQQTQNVFAEAAQNVGFVFKGENYVTVHDEILAALTNVQEGADPDAEWDAALSRIQTNLSR